MHFFLKLSSRETTGPQHESRVLDFCSKTSIITQAVIETVSMDRSKFVSVLKTSVNEKLEEFIQSQGIHSIARLGIISVKDNSSFNTNIFRLSNVPAYSIYQA